MRDLNREIENSLRTLSSFRVKSGLALAEREESEGEEIDEEWGDKIIP